MELTNQKDKNSTSKKTAVLKNKKNHQKLQKALRENLLRRKSANLQPKTS